jgi:hypothetical protein
MLTLEKYPIRMSYSINTLFWLDDIGVPHTSPWTWFEFTTLVVIGTDCTGSCKSNYHTITTTTVSSMSRFSSINLPIIDKTVDYVCSVYHITRVSYSHSTESRNKTQFYNLCIYDRQVEHCIHYIGCKHLSICGK